MQRRKLKELGMNVKARGPCGGCLGGEDFLERFSRRPNPPVMPTQFWINQPEVEPQKKLTATVTFDLIRFITRPYGWTSSLPVGDRGGREYGCSSIRAAPSRVRYTKGSSGR